MKQREREECLSREKKSTREEKRKILVSKTKNSKKKTPHFSLQLVASRWSGGVVVVACAYFMRGKYTLNNSHEY